MVEARPLEALTRYFQISALWVRASRAYPMSWWMLVIGGLPHHRRGVRRHLDPVPERRQPRRLLPARGRLPVRRRWTCVRGGGPVRGPSRAARPDDPAREARPDDDPAGPAADPGLRRRVRAAPALSSGTGRAGPRLGLHLRGLDGLEGAAPGRDARRGVGDLHRSLRRAGLHPVLDDRLGRGGQRLHLRRQHRHAVPAHRLPERGAQGADLRGAAGLRELVSEPAHPGPRGPARATPTGRSGCPRSSRRPWSRWRCSSGAPACASTDRPGADTDDADRGRAPRPGPSAAAAAPTSTPSRTSRSPSRPARWSATSAPTAPGSRRRSRC